MPDAPHQSAPEQHNSAMNLLTQLPAACWSLIIDRLSVADLVTLAASSREVAQLLQAPGLLLQACSSHLGWPPAAACRTRAPPATSTAAACKPLFCKHAHGQQQLQLQEQEQASSNLLTGDAGWQPWSAAGGLAAAATGKDDDACAWQAATSMAAVAHACSRTLRPRFRPQAFPIPPWLSVQPGRARGFARVQADSLNPSLVLGEAEAAWLELGSLAGHAGGVFTSTCSSSPRSQAACGFVAAVVINKALVAELYLPAGCSAPDRWGSLLTAADAAVDSSSCTAAGQQQQQQEEEGEAGSSGAEGPAQQQQQQQRGVQLELWLASSVLLLPPEQPPAAAAGSSRRRRGPAGSTAAAAAAGVVTWQQIHALLMGCVRDNAARSRAVRWTAFVPPGTAAAADLEQRLARLLQAGAPVLDLRRCSFWPASPAERQQQQQQQQARSRQRQRAGAAGISAVQQATAALTLHHQQDDAACSSSSSSGGGGGGGGGCARLSQLAAAKLAWRQVTRSVQAALAAAVAAQLATHAPNATSSSSSSSSSGQQCPLTDDAIGEALAALVQQLPLLAPGLQLLVLPMLLPGGRAAGVRLAGGSSGSRGSRLSAPRLLSLNVSFLIPLRSAWDRLPQLRQVLLMVHSSSSSSSTSGPAVCGSSSGAVMAERGAADAAAGGQRLLRGVFSLQALEQQWQQAAAGSSQQQPPPGGKGGRQQQWQSAEDAALDEIVNADAGGREDCEGDSGERLYQEGSSGGCGAEPAAALMLPQTAVEAVHGMVLSCMDRCSDAVLLGSA